MLFPATAFLGAALLFGVQPLIAREVIPVLGGSPSVWTTCVLFFQGTLLLGYVYAHALGKVGGLRAQALVHVAVLLTAASLLPSGFTPTNAPLSGGSDPPTVWLLVMLATTIGPAAFVISSTGPLVQAWLVRARGGDPYHVYAFSNAGSLMALLAYPTLVEPALSLSQQFSIWKAAYWSFVVLMSLCAVVAAASRAAARDGHGVADSTEASPPRSVSTALLWVVLAAIPSSLMLGVTTYLSTDVAAVPLLWVVPCSLYLLTLIVSFSRYLPRISRLSIHLLPLIVPAVLAVQTAFAPSPALLFMGLQLVAFVVASLACHTALATRRPEAARLTGFYIWVAIGGVLGGAFNTVAAPVLFRVVLEYPLMLIAGLVVPAWCAGSRAWQSWWRYAAVGAVAIVPGALMLQADVSRAVMVLLAVGLPLAFFFASRHPGVQAGVVVILLAAPFVATTRQETVLYRARSFFGVHRVIAIDGGASHVLQHGTTVHGRQVRSEALRREPASYYQRVGPFGDIDIVSTARGGARRVGVAGLGTGALAAYARPHEDWVFFEIDQTVERIARNPAFFTHLTDCGAPCLVVLGDARISIRGAPARSFDLLVFDVFSSDAIPVHMLTREAIAEYRGRLRAGGLMAFHISNRYLHLPPVLAAGAAANGLSAVMRNYTASRDDEPRGGLSSDWLVMAETGDAIAPLVSHGWTPVTGAASDGVSWTDDYSNVLAVATWRRRGH